MPNNLYLLIDDATRQFVVIDPSMGSEAARERVRTLLSEGYAFTAIWNTHGHFDHIYDNAIWHQGFGASIWMHRDDELFLERLPEQSLWLGFAAPDVVLPAHWLQGGQTLTVGEHRAQVLHTPGHSPGSVSFLFADEGHCFSGDVLFRGSVGRTDLPGCSFPVLQQSLLALARLPAATHIFSGHGDSTTVGDELATNPFYQPLLDLIDSTQETP
jgi:glyoxylase-like metal-dependent hydrolase (beta-lactamase superfamily II)